MALVPGTVNGKPAVIPDNFARLWPGVYKIDAQTPEKAPAGSDQTAPATPRARKD